ncbi:MAG: NAD-dependent epimerase/dehydratase family protein [Daejeonella sp.]
MARICITGSNGFLGSVIVNSLKDQFCTIQTIGRSKTNDICCDLAQAIPKLENGFDTIIHVAGKAHSVPKNNAEENEFFQVNTEGTKNLIHGIEQSNSLPKSLVFISTVAVYGMDKGDLLDESTPRGAKDPYGLSKILAEDYLLDWGSKNNVKITIIRPPLIVGINPPGNLGAMIKGIKSGLYFNINGGQAKRSMVLAEDLANFIPFLSPIGGIYNLTDGHNPSFSELSNMITNFYGKQQVFDISSGLAKLIAKTGDVCPSILGMELPFNSRKLSKMTDSLTYSDHRAKSLGWKPRDVLGNPTKWLE